MQHSTFIVGLARSIGPLVKLYRTTNCASALELAIILAKKATDEFFTADGGYDRETFGTHTHSTTCVMSSLAQLAELTSDAHLMERVRAFYDNGPWQIRDELVWVIESSADKADPDRGEVNNTGDIVETALILADGTIRNTIRMPNGFCAAICYRRNCVMSRLSRIRPTSRAKMGSITSPSATLALLAFQHPMVTNC